MNQDFALKTRFLTRHPYILKRKILEGEIDKEKFLLQGLLELLEAVEKSGLEGSVFNCRDNRYHEVLIFIKKNNPDFNTSAYEDAYENMVNHYTTGIRKRTIEEKGESLRKFGEENYHFVPVRYKEPIKLLV